MDPAQSTTYEAFEYQVCKRKIGYVSKREAQKQLKSMQNKKGQCSSKLKTYSCPVCGFFHIGGNKSKK